MARRKLSKKPTRKTYKRSSGMGKIGTNIVTPIAQVTGALTFNLVKNKFLANQSDAVKGALGVAIGFLASNYSKNSFINGLGQGMIVAGGLTLGKAVAPAIFGATDDLLVISGLDQIGEPGEINTIQGIDPNQISTINGLDQIGNDDMNGADDMGDISTINGIANTYNEF